jgi:hypothetical protein
MEPLHDYEMWCRVVVSVRSVWCPWWRNATQWMDDSGAGGLLRAGVWGSSAEARHEADPEKETQDKPGHEPACSV